MEGAVLMALSNNRDLRARRLEPVIAGTFEGIERGVFDPEVFGEFEFYQEKASETSRSTGASYSVDGRDALAEAGIRQELPSGTSLEATVSQERSISNRAPEQQRARLGLSVAQSLLRGFGPAVNLVRVRQAELDAEASRHELRGYVEALLAETEIAYWNYVLSGREIAIFERSLEVARRQRDDIEQRIEVGLLPEIEAAAARRDQALIEARGLLEENRLRLARLITPHPDGSLDLDIHPTSDPRIPAEPVTDLADRIQLADRSRADLAEARLRLEQNRLETVRTRNGLLPRLELFMDLGGTGYADTFDDSFRELDGETYDFTAGVRFSRHLGNRAADARNRAALASRRQATEALANLQRMARLDVRLAVNEMERTRLRVEASRITRELEEETLNAERERFDVGSGTALLVAQAQRDLLAARIEEARAVVNYRIAKTKLFLAEGSLLERRGVVLGDGAGSENGGNDSGR